MPYERDVRLLERLEEVTLQLMRRMHAKMEGSTPEVTGSQFFVLKRIHERGRMTVSVLAEEIGVSLSAVTALMDRLVKSGYVTRSRDEGDRRLVWLEVTPQGEEVLKACLARCKQVMERYLGQLSGEDLEQLVKIYEKLLTIMEQEDKE